MPIIHSARTTPRSHTDTMNTNTQLTDAIRAVLNNPNESLCYCDEGWIAVYSDWAEQYRGEYMIVSDREGLYAMAGDAEPTDIVEGLAEYCDDNLQVWLRESLDDELDAPEPNEDRVTMLKGLIK